MNLFKQTLGYSLAMIFIRLQAFLLLPFVARHVSTEELSIFDPLVTYATVLGMFALLGLDGALATLYQHPDYKSGRRSLAGTAILIVMGASLVAGAGLVACTGYIEHTVFRDRWDLSVEMMLTAGGIVMGSLQQICAITLRQEFQVKKFNISVIGGGLLSFVATIVVVIWLRCGVRGMLVVTLITGALKAALMVWWVRPYVEFRFNRAALKPLFMLGLPLLPLSVCSWLMSGLDRSLLQMWRTPQEVVDYGMANRFAMLAVVVTAAFQTAWWPYAMSKAREPGIASHFQQVCRVACVGGALLAAGVAAVTPILMWLVLPEKYHQSFHTTGLQVLGNVIYTYYYFPLVSLLVMLKIKLEVLGHLAGMAITVALDLLLVKPFGVSGAVMATVVGFLMLAAVVGRLAKKHLDFGFPLLRAEAFFLITAAALSVWLWLPATNVTQVLLNTGLSLVGITLAGLFTRLLRREDAALIPAVLEKVKKKIQPPSRGQCLMSARPPLDSALMNSRSYQECTTCVMDTSDRDLTFDGAGVCDYCRTVPARLEQYWLRGAGGQAALDQLIDRIRKSGKGRAYDCIIGLSGGVDSSWLALKAKDWGLRVLAFHSDAGWNSELAVQNIEHLTNYCGFDLQTDILPWEEVRDVQLAYLKAGVLNQDVPQDQGFFASLYKATRQFKIRYNLDGANLSTECVLPASYVGYSNSRDARNLVAIHKAYGTIPLREYPLLSVLKTLLYRNGLFMDIASPLNFMEYNKPAALQELQERAGYKPYAGKHGESVFTKFYQDYFLPRRYQIDKRRAHLSSLVITKQMTRGEAKAELARPPLTPREEEAVIDYICTKTRLTREEFDTIMSMPMRQHSEFANCRRLEGFASKYVMWPVRKWRRLRGVIR